MAAPYLSVLRMSTALSGGGGGNADGTTPPTQPMDPERAAWLREALANTLVDPVVEMKKLLVTLEKEKDNADKEIECLQKLTEYVESIDFARDLHKIGGLKTVIERISTSPHSTVRTAAAETLGTVVQNNPETQTWALELDVLGVLCNALRNHGDATPSERGKLMFALSSLIRQHDIATVKFIQECKGFALLLDVLALKKKQGDDDDVSATLPIRRKCVFLLTYLVTRAPTVISVSSFRVIPQLIQELHEKDADLCGKTLTLLTEYGKNEHVRKESGMMVREALQLFETSTTVKEDVLEEFVSCRAVWM